MKSRFCVAVLLASQWLGVAVAAPSLESFAAPEEIKDAMLSPDGRYLAVITTRDERRIVLVRDLQVDSKLAPVMAPSEKDDFDIVWCRFANNTRLLCGFRGTALVRMSMRSSSVLAAVDADGKNLNELASSQTGRPTAPDERIFDRVAETPNKVIVRSDIGDTTASTLPTYLYSVDLADGRINHVKESLDDRRLWNTYTDGAGHLRLGLGYQKRGPDMYTDANGGVFVMESRRDVEQTVLATTDGKEWRALEKATEFAKSSPFLRLAFDAVSGRAFGFAPSNGRTALWEVDLKDAAAPTVTFAHAKVDVGDVVTDGSGRIIGVSYEAEKPQVRYVDEKLAAIVRGVEKAMPNSFTYIRSMSTDAKRLLIVSRSDVEPGRFLVYESESRKITPLGSVNSKLDSKELAPMRAIEYTAADGKKISGYLTAMSEPKAAPMVVVLHDGEGRSRWAYDELTQYLATRGYAVLSVNFRGSAGFGKEWRDAGRNQWGGVMYSDVADGVQWAVTQGIADPRRVCVIGRGSTGYTALIGAMKESKLFKCVGSIGGRSDMVDFAAAMRGPRGPSAPASETDAGKNAAPKEEWPVRNAEKMNVPVLLIHGSHDTRSPVAQSEEMAKELQRAGKPHKLVKIERATQFFWRPAERAAVLKEVDAFISANLAASE